MIWRTLLEIELGEFRSTAISAAAVTHLLCPSDRLFYFSQVISIPNLIAHQEWCLYPFDLCSLYSFHYLEV
jgi:hypothetical protein